MPIIVKNPNPGHIDEYLMIEIQGDLENRNEEVKDVSGSFVGDVLFNKFGHPVSSFVIAKFFNNVFLFFKILIIGHHIMYGTERKLEKPFAVIEKLETTTSENHDESIIADSQPNMSLSILDSTVNIENRTKSQVIS